MKVLFHLDADAFFVSASQTIRPETKGKPVAISGKKGNSVIGSASYEARAKGVGSAMVIKEALKLCPELIIIPADFELYETLSKRMFEILSVKYTNEVEVVSIDECYIDVTDIWKKYGSAFKLARDMQKTIEKELGFTVSIGVSYTRWLAKMCSDIRKPNGITSVGPKQVKETIWKLPIDKYYGIGKKTWPLLNENGIETIGDLAKLKPESELAITFFKNRAKHIIDTTYGNSSNVVDNSKIRHKEISSSKTLKEGYSNNRQEIIETLRFLTEKVAYTAKHEGKIGMVVGVTIKNTNFVVKQKQQKLRIPVQSADEIFPIALSLFDKSWRGEDIRLIGVKIGQTKNINSWTYQQSFFDKPREPRIWPIV
ncbi:Y-family DNA polymerase [Mycoplasma todarodis]|uniref:Y-family DNA polymerase n=1 Tax=Mycoplasma todarodis TaxID=1937191 RepID=UPI003B2A15A4